MCFFSFFMLPLLSNKEANVMYYTAIRHDGHSRTRGKCRKHEKNIILQRTAKCSQPFIIVFYISRVFTNVRSVLSHCNARLRLLHLLYDIKETCHKTIKHAFSLYYTLIKHGFLPIRAHRVQSIL